MKILIEKNNEIKEKIKYLKELLYKKESCFDSPHKIIFNEIRDNLEECLLSNILIGKNLDFLEKIEEYKKIGNGKSPEERFFEIINSDIEKTKIFDIESKEKKE